MDMKLNEIQIECFKGIKHFEADFDGENATIIAANGIGKTTVYDAFLWLLFGKDSTGRKDFDLRPLDEENQPIKGLVVGVSANIEIDEEPHTFRKEHHENIVKGQLRGYETLCWINDVPKKVSEYQEYVAEIIPEDSFKMLTNLRHFNEGLHWKERRSVLLAIAGEIGTPTGFDILLGQLRGRSLDDFKKVLADQKKRLVKDRDEINPRIDELQRGLEGYAGADTKKIENTRTLLKGDLSAIDDRRTSLLNGERARQQKIDNLNSLKNQQAARERALANDKSPVKHLLDEKATIEQGVSLKGTAVNTAKTAFDTKMGEILNEKRRLEQQIRTLNEIRDEYNRVSVETDPDTCSLCGQALPADKVQEIAERKEAKLLEISNRGNARKRVFKDQQQKIAALEAELPGLTDLLEKAKIELKESETYKTERFAAIDDLVKHNRTLPPDKDPLWLDFKSQIEKLNGEIGEPIAEQLTAIEAERRSKQGEIDGLNNVLAQADRLKQDKARIVELGENEKALTQQIADIDATLASIEQYRAAESNLITEAVNGKFKYVKFKLFNQLLNTGIEECCEAMLDGKPYGAMSYGEKIIVGIDITNTLSIHYGISTPLFCDNAESLTFPIESNSQTIRLVAQKGVKKLTIEKEEQVCSARE